MANLYFHRKTGSMVTLSNSNKSAQRNYPHQEFNNGLIMSCEPLRDDQIFEVRIDKKVPTWSGSVEIGVTSLDPSTLEFPSSATNLREGSWVMSGTSVLQDGKSIVEEYGEDLDQLAEGDRVGVMRASNGDLHFFVNGVDQGVAAAGIASSVYAVVDMYGKCAQVSVVDSTESSVATTTVEEGLRFHERCGSMVKLSNGNRTAERKKPVDEFNNGVVMTHRPLKDNEVFEIRIDELVNKWSGSIEMGITTHNPDTLEFPATMTNMRSGTVMMSGCGILTNGKGSRREYGEFNLDELHEGDRIALVKKSNGNLHYYINGMDQGIAAENVPPIVYGVVDLYGMTVKVTVAETCNTNFTADESIQSSSTIHGNQHKNCNTLNDVSEKLLFHPRCGLHVMVVNGGQTALRPNSLDDFNNAVVLTSRPLKADEFFQVLLEQVVMKWAGSIEIGVTTHSPQDLEFPSTMTNVQSGTWMMTGNGIIYNGITIIDEYGRNLDQLKAGDRVGVTRTEQGKLHFYVNGIDQGLAACNVPEGVYGVIDLYGQAAKASVVYNSDVSNSSLERLDFLAVETENSFSQGVLPALPEKKNTPLAKIEVDHINATSRSGATVNTAAHYSEGVWQCRNGSDQCTPSNAPPESNQLFYAICGRNITLKNGGCTALRSRSFNNGLVFSAKPIMQDELFLIEIDKVNPHWAGSLILGLTNFFPINPVVLPSSATDFTISDSWILIGSQLVKNGQVLKENYAPSFCRLSVGDVIGVKKSSDGSLRFFLNGVDLGIAAINLPKKLYVMVDVHGCVEAVSISQASAARQSSTPSKNTENNEIKSLERVTLKTDSSSQSFHENHGRNIQITGNLCARRVASYNQGLVLSNRSLHHDELFQVRIDNLHTRWTSSLQIGVTNQCPDKLFLPVSALSMHRGTWIICGDSVFQNGVKIRARYGPNLDSLQSCHLVGVKVDPEGRLHLYVNGIDQGVAAEGILFPCYCVVDVYGQCQQVTIVEDEYCAENEVERDNREKADIDNGIKEKILKSLSIDNQPVRNCEYQNCCARFKAMLGLPDNFFMPEQVVCYCETCHKLRGDEPYFKKGEPPRDYALPFGWCRFALRLSPKTENANIQEKWHVAFHGTEVGAVRKILDNGQLLPPENIGLALCSKDVVRNANVKDAESCHVVLSPTLRYAGCSTFSPKQEFVDSQTKNAYHCRVAFQVFVRPGSYKAGPARCCAPRFEQPGAVDPIDVHFSNSDLEWYTKEQGSTVLHCLLIRIEGF